MYTLEQIVAKLAQRAKPDLVPDIVKPVVMVKGSNYEMGYQYGQQLHDQIILHTLLLATKLMTVRHDGKVIEDALRYEEVLRRQSPDFAEMLHGTADALGLPYEAVLLYVIPNLMGAVPPSQCSTISAWGKATKDGRLYTGANADGGAFTPTSYGPTLVMFPDKGYVNVSNGGYNSNLAMNSQGLVIMASNGGWNGRKGDIGYGTAAVSSTMYLVKHCKSARDALDKLTKEMSPVSSAENLHCVDPSGDACIIESTFGHRGIRRSGDLGEKDYLLATNFFLSEEMQTSAPRDLTDQNAQYRYRSEEQLIRESYGKISPMQLNAILSCLDFYALDGNWIKNVWDPEGSRNTPEKRSYKNATYMQCLTDPEHRIAYFKQGENCAICSNVPGSTGFYSKLELRDSPEQMAEASVTEAKCRLYALSARVAQGELPYALVEARMTQAKQYVWQGENYKAMALAMEQDRERLAYLSKALTLFSKAQVLLQA